MVGRQRVEVEVGGGEDARARRAPALASDDVDAGDAGVGHRRAT